MSDGQNFLIQNKVDEEIYENSFHNSASASSIHDGLNTSKFNLKYLNLKYTK